MTEDQGQQLIDLLIAQGHLLALLPQALSYLAAIFRAMEILIVIAAISSVVITLLLAPRGE